MQRKIPPRNYLMTTKIKRKEKYTYEEKISVNAVLCRDDVGFSGICG